MKQRENFGGSRNYTNMLCRPLSKPSFQMGHKTGICLAKIGYYSTDLTHTSTSANKYSSERYLAICTPLERGLLRPFQKPERALKIKRSTFAYRWMTLKPILKKTFQKSCRKISHCSVAKNQRSPEPHNLICEIIVRGSHLPSFCHISLNCRMTPPGFIGLHLHLMEIGFTAIPLFALHILAVGLFALWLAHPFTPPTKLNIGPCQYWSARDHSTVLPSTVLKREHMVNQPP